jgi:phospholipase/lecithinase/hemolysin
MRFARRGLTTTTRRNRTTGMMFCVAWLLLLLSATTGRSFTALYVFGDSLSDTGNNPATPAQSYYNGRYSNGPLWVEYLSADLGLPYNASNNFAYAGSTTSDLATQIAGVTPSTNLPSALFTLESGGNDFLENALALGTNDAGWSNAVATSVANLTNAVSALFALGAREIAVGNLANIGQTPAAALFASEPGFASYVDSKVALFNALLAAGITNVMQQNPGLRIYLLDDNALLTKILSAPASYGFTVTTVGALEDPNLTDKSFNGPGADYVFWDLIHPTTKVNALTAAAAFQSVAVQLNVMRNGPSVNLAASNLYPGLPYIIETSTNLSTWSAYETITPTGATASVTLTNEPGANVFYRVRY